MHGVSPAAVRFVTAGIYLILASCGEVLHLAGHARRSDVAETATISAWTPRSCHHGHCHHAPQRSSAEDDSDDSGSTPRPTHDADDCARCSQLAAPGLTPVAVTAAGLPAVPPTRFLEAIPRPPQVRRVLALSRGPPAGVAV